MQYYPTESQQEYEEALRKKNAQTYGGLAMMGLLCLGAFALITAPKSSPTSSPQNVGVFSKVEYDYMEKKFEIEQDKDNYRKQVNK